MSAEHRLDELVDRARSGEPRAVGRLISLVENDSDALRPLAQLLATMPERAHVVGLTGAPGVGKSTMTSALVGSLRARSHRVGVLAVDPSSPYSGGALLGDRVRMQEHATDPDVYIRSMATRGHLGGLAAAAPAALRVLDAAGCDVILVETVGVGQSELEIVSRADTTLVLVAPGLGDGVQAVKAGILEIADVFVVNKADREDADRVVRDLRSMQALGGRHSTPDAWRPPVVRTVAIDGAGGQGMGDMVTAIDEHRAWLERTGGLAERRAARSTAEIEALVVERLRRRLRDPLSARLDELGRAVAEGDLDAYSAADNLWEAVHREADGR